MTAAAVISSSDNSTDNGGEDCFCWVDCAPIHIIYKRYRTDDGRTLLGIVFGSIHWLFYFRMKTRSVRHNEWNTVVIQRILCRSGWEMFIVTWIVHWKKWHLFVRCRERLPGTTFVDVRARWILIALNVSIAPFLIWSIESCPIWQNSGRNVTISADRRWWIMLITNCRYRFGCNASLLT
jgi:hypothetical protein